MFGQSSALQIQLESIRSVAQYHQSCRLSKGQQGNECGKEKDKKYLLMYNHFGCQMTTFSFSFDNFMVVLHIAALLDYSYVRDVYSMVESLV